MFDSMMRDMMWEEMSIDDMDIMQYTALTAEEENAAVKAYDEIHGPVVSRPTQQSTEGELHHGA